jgi:hypothetical protein
MHRFGRTAQNKLKDRWGGSFILATIVALVGAWYVGSWLNNQLNGVPTTKDNPTTPKVVQGVVAQPAAFKIFFVQAGAFRSEANARGLVKSLSDKGYVGMVSPRASTGVYNVYAGAFTESASAESIKAKLITEGTKAFTVQVGVDYNPEAVAAMTGVKVDDLKPGLDAMNSYLQEVTRWVESKAAGASVEPTAILAHGKQLGDMATRLISNTDPKIKGFVQMATDASNHAAALESVSADNNANTEEFQAVMSGYMSLLTTYRNYK